jgi:hypothetical protein
MQKIPLKLKSEDKWEYTETWKNVDEYPKYDVSTWGRVMSHKYGKKRILKWYYNTDGRPFVRLYNEKGSKNYPIHLLVARTFIPNPLGLPDCDHKDVNYLNNNVKNLRWLTKPENAKNKKTPCYSIHTGVSKKNARWYVSINIDGKQIHIGIYDTEEEAFQARNAYKLTNNIVRPDDL